MRKIYSDFPDKFMIVGGINKRALSKDYKAIEGEVDRVMGYLKRGEVICLSCYSG